MRLFSLMQAIRHGGESMKYILLLSCLPSAALVLGAAIQGRYVLAALSVVLVYQFAYWGIWEASQPEVRR